MQTVYESAFMHLAYDPTTELLVATWRPASYVMQDEDYKEEMTKHLSINAQFLPKRIIANMQEFFFTVDSSLQLWTNEHYFLPSLALGVSFAAIIVSKELIAQLSIEQTMSESEGSRFISQYFDDLENAKKWILSQEITYLV